MGQAVTRKLVFRLGGVAFSLDLSFVVEICEQVADLLDLTCPDLTVGIVGALTFRNTRVPAIDPAARLGLSPATASSGRTALILTSSEGNWALLVDRVENISPVEKFQSLELPSLFRGAVSEHYSQVELFCSEPIICFEPERFYGISGLIT